MLTINTQIPTIHRGKIRSIVKAHSGWDAWYKAKGIISAQATNAQLIEFALQYPSLVATIEMILGQTVVLNIIEDTPDMNDTNDTNDTTETSAEASEAPSPQAEGFQLDSVLGPVDQLLAPLVRDELAKALAPVIAAANKGPIEVERIVEVERVVEVAPGEAPRVMIPKARRDKRVPFRSLFPSRAKDAWNDALITLWSGAAAPAIDPFYVVDRQQMATLLTAFERGTNVWLTGPSASGKSTMPEQAAAAVGRPFVKLGFSKQTDVDSLIGGPSLHNGSTRWEDGALIKAMRQPGTIILIDELTFAPAGVQAIIQLTADDHRTYTLPTGEIVKAADGVVFCVADNTNGAGDEGGLYAGTNVSNVALVTRFKRMIHVDYLSPQREAEALANHTSCPLPAARHLADFVAQARKLPTLQGVVISLRQMVGFVQMVQDGFSSKDAFEATISSRMPATERATIEGLADLSWNTSFEALVRGTTAPATPIQPSNSPAAKAFGDVEF